MDKEDIRTVMSVVGVSISVVSLIISVVILGVVL